MNCALKLIQSVAAFQELFSEHLYSRHVQKYAFQGSSFSATESIYSSLYYNWSVVEKLDAFRFFCCQFFTRVACWIDKALSRIHPHPMQSNADCQSASGPQSGSYSHSDSYSQNDLDAETMSRLASKCCKRTCLWQQPEVGKLA